jgi:hypothetical protein
MDAKKKSGEPGAGFCQNMAVPIGDLPSFLIRVAIPILDPAACLSSISAVNIGKIHNEWRTAFIGAAITHVFVNMLSGRQSRIIRCSGHDFKKVTPCLEYAAVSAVSNAENPCA